MVREALFPCSFVPERSADSELIELLKGLAGEAGQGVAPDVFSERLDRLGQLLSRHISSEEQYSAAASSSMPCSQSHIQEHNLMLEQYVQWQFDLMKMNASPRAEICRKIEGWLACHAFVSCPDVEAGQAR
jgi:hemerythrin